MGLIKFKKEKFRTNNKYITISVMIFLTLILTSVGSFDQKTHFADASSLDNVVSGQVFQDFNLNRIIDPDDVGLQNWNLTLTGRVLHNGFINPLDVTSDANGFFSFNNLETGTYNVTVNIPVGWGPTSPPVVLNIPLVGNSSRITNFGAQNIKQVISKSDFTGLSAEEIVFDSKGYLYDPETLDGNIKKFDDKGNLISTIGSSGKAFNQFYRPVGITLDSNDDLWVSDQNNCIYKFDNDGNFLKRFCTSTAGKFAFPRGLAFDAQDNLYVTDGNNNRVLKFDQNGNYLREIGKGGGWTNGYFIIPYYVAFDLNGNIYVVDTGDNRIQKFDSNGNFLASYGHTGVSPDAFNRPRAIAFDSNNNAYVADAYNNRIQVFDSNFTFVRSFGSFGSDHGQFVNPSGIAVDANGKIYVADVSNARIEKFDNKGNFQSQFLARTSKMQPYFVTMDTADRLLVTDGTNHKVLVFDAQSGSFLSQFSRIGTAPGEFHGPRGVKIGSGGNIIVADNYNNRVQKFDHNGNFLSSFGNTGDGPGQFNQVRGIAIDSSGNILAADTNGARIEKFDPNGKFLLSFNVSNPYGINIDSQGNIYAAELYANYVEKFAPNGTSLLRFGGFGQEPGQFYSPRDVFIDKNGTMYVTDDYNNRVQVFSKDGAFLFSFGSFGSEPSQFTSPRGIIVDKSGDIWVGDVGNSRISEFDNNGSPIKQIYFSVSGVNVTGTVNRPPDSNGWYNNPVTISWSANEDGTGIASCDPPTTYSGPDGKDVVITGHCIDKEGVTGISAVQIKYDTSPPTLSLPSQVVVGSANPSGTIVNYTVFASDSIDSSVSPTCSPPSGSTFPIGITTVTCNATDLAGNLGTGQFVVNVKVKTVLKSFIPSSVQLGQPLALTGLITDSSGGGIGGMKITFRGTATSNGINFSPVITNPDGTFSETIKAPNTVSIGWTIQALFSGTAKYTASVSPIVKFDTIIPPLVPSKDSYIINGTPDINEGTSSILKVQQLRQMRSLLSFDLPPFENAHVSNVILRIFSQANGFNWGNEETIEVHKLTTLWTEGNGFNATRGTGQGVTWNCAKDANITDTITNCNQQWNGGSYATTPSDIKPITNTTKGIWLEFNVTNDVKSLLDLHKNDNFGWIIKKTNENSNGSVAFVSKESSDISHRPQLVVTFGP